jgi:hypothetical protein
MFQNFPQIASVQKGTFLPLNQYLSSTVTSSFTTLSSMDHFHKIKEGGNIEQTDFTLSYEEAKSTIKTAYNKAWKQNHPDHDQHHYSNHQLTKAEQVTIRLSEVGTIYSTSTE